MDNFYTGKFLFAMKSGILLCFHLVTISIVFQSNVLVFFATAPILDYVPGNHPLSVTVGTIRLFFHM